MANWKELAKKYNIQIEIWGLPSLAKFKILSPNWLKYKTYITQEMLKRGFLAGNAVYVCTHHTENIVSEYFKIQSFREKQFKNIEFDHIISVCDNAKEKCPIFFSENAIRTHHPFFDPSSIKNPKLIESAFAKCRDEIKLFCKDFSEKNFS